MFIMHNDNSYNNNNNKKRFVSFVEMFKKLKLKKRKLFTKFP